MAAARYFLPDHATLKDVYSRHELRTMLLAGTLSRSDMVLDDETGLAHLLGDLLAMPYPDATVMPTRSTSGLQPRPSPPGGSHEFRADTPLPKPEPKRTAPSAEEDPDEEEDGGDLDSDEDQFEDDGLYEDEEDEDDAPRRPAQSGARLQYAPPGMAEDEQDVDESTPEQDTAAESGGEPEELLYVGHPSWFSYPRALLATALAGTAAWLSCEYRFGLEWILLFSSVAGLVLLFMGLDRYTSTFYITTRRVEMEYGIIGRNTKEVRICDIRAIDVHQKGLSALLGLGTVKFDSSASAGPEVYFKNVRRPHDIKELVRELQG